MMVEESNGHLIAVTYLSHGYDFGQKPHLYLNPRSSTLFDKILVV